MNIRFPVELFAKIRLEANERQCNIPRLIIEIVTEALKDKHNSH